MLAFAGFSLVLSPPCLDRAERGRGAITADTGGAGGEGRGGGGGGVDGMGGSLALKLSVEEPRLSSERSAP